MLSSWLSTKAEVQQDPQSFWSFIDETAITGGVAMKGRIIIHTALQDKALKPLHQNHMGKEKT